MPICNSTPHGELFWCHFRGWSQNLSLIIIFRNGAREEPKQCHFTERGAIFKKRLKTVPGWSQNGASEEPKQCLFQRKGAVSKLFLKRSHFVLENSATLEGGAVFFLDMIVREKNRSDSHKGVFINHHQGGASNKW